MVIQAKALLRQAMLEKRKALSVTARQDQDQSLFDQLISLPSIYHAETFLLTLSCNGECDTWQFAQWMIRRKGFIVLPRVDKETKNLKLHRVSSLLEELIKGTYGIYEPRIECESFLPSDIEWALLPGLAFDKTGSRLGYGGGYFDRLLLSIPSVAYRVSLAYRFQLVDCVPCEVHDQKIDTLVLPNGSFQIPHLLTGF